jgi:Mrp family chromosome partitioning ATPase
VPAGTAVSVFRFRRTDLAPADPRRRAGAGHDPARATLIRPRVDPARTWEALNPVAADERQLALKRLVAASPGDPAAAAFDVLRTQLVQAAAENGWRRIAVTSPTAGCGKNFVLANLALALSRRPDFRTVVVDLDLRSPSLAALFGVADAGRLADVLSGEQPVEAMFHRVGRSLALGLNDRPEAGSAEILQDPRTAETIAAIERALMPDLTLFDLPPLLDGDDALGFLPRVDGVLLVADGTRTLAREMTAAERLLKDRTVFVGVVLNRAESTAVGR